MRVFAQLRALSDLRRRYLPYLQTLEDHDIAREIGHYQVIGAPLTAKQLLHVGIGASATVQRRLRRLKELGIVHESRSQEDRRSIELTLSPACLRAFARCGVHLGEPRPAARPKKRIATHRCVLCEGAAARHKIAARFLGDGLRRGMRCILIGARHAGPAHVVAVTHDIGQVREAMEQARREARRIRIVNDAAGADQRDVEALLAFDAQLDKLAREYRAELLCEYDAALMTGPHLFKVLEQHWDGDRAIALAGARPRS